MKAIAVFTTVASLDEARKLGRAMVQRKLAACAQISEIESFYNWDGALQNEREYRIVFKATDQGYAALEQAIRSLHSYQLPAIHAILLDRVSVSYAQWIVANASAGTEP